MFGYTIGHPDADLAPDERDSAPSMPKSVVIEPAFTWGADRPPRTPWEETIIYEVHIKGFTVRHPEVPRELRGTYAGLGSPVMIDYLVGARRHRGRAAARAPLRGTRSPSWIAG